LSRLPGGGMTQSTRLGFSNQIHTPSGMMNPIIGMKSTPDH
jgi:hypothetical protein